MNFYKLKNAFFVFFLLFSIFYFLFSAFASAQAAVIDLWKDVSLACQPSCGQDEISAGIKCGTCTLTDALQIGVNIAKIILQFLGVAALVVFIYGGIMWITSGGNPEQVNKGKRALVGALIGIAIVLFAYVIVFNIMKLLGVQGASYYPQAGERTCSGTFGADYACRDMFECKSGTIRTGYCPGGANIVCCVKGACSDYGPEYACRPDSECKSGTIKEPSYCQEPNKCCEPLP